MKKFIMGLLIGLMVSASFLVFAESEQFTALKASFNILVNGVAFTSEKPAVVIDGSTYLPLKAVGEALGVKVSWNNEKYRVEIGDSSLAPSGYTYDNPAPINTTQTLYVNSYSQNYTVQMTVKDIVRGDNAWSMIYQANKYNHAAPQGYEYVLAKINIKVIDIAAGKALTITPVVDFDMISNEGKVYEYASAVLPTPELDCSLYKGASHEGWAVFLVKSTDLQPKIAYGRAFDGSGGLWFKAYK